VHTHAESCVRVRMRECLPPANIIRHGVTGVTRRHPATACQLQLQLRSHQTPLLMIVGHIVAAAAVCCTPRPRPTHTINRPTERPATAVLRPRTLPARGRRRAGWGGSRACAPG
jgi:hypothetical protein